MKLDCSEISIKKKQCAHSIAHSQQQKSPVMLTLTLLVTLAFLLDIIWRRHGNSVPKQHIFHSLTVSALNISTKYSTLSQPYSSVLTHPLFIFFTVFICSVGFLSIRRKPFTVFLLCLVVIRPWASVINLYGYYAPEHK